MILIETVFSWPGTGFLLNAAIFQRDLPQPDATHLRHIVLSAVTMYSHGNHRSDRAGFGCREQEFV